MAPLRDSLQRGFYFLSVYMLTLQIHEHSCSVMKASNRTAVSDTGGNRRGSEGTISQGKRKWPIGVKPKSGQVLLHLLASSGKAYVFPNSCLKGTNLFDFMVIMCVQGNE